MTPIPALHRALARSISTSQLSLPSPSSPKQADQLHAHLLVTGALLRPPAIAHLLSCFADDLHRAFRVFFHVPRPPTFLWNTLIRVCSQRNAPEESFLLYRRMRREGVERDGHTFSFLLRACSGLSSPRGQSVHGNFIRAFPEGDSLVGNSLIHMYSELGLVELARKAFEETPRKDIVSWTTILSGYSKKGRMEEAQTLFDQMPVRNVVSWTCLISGYSHGGLPSQAITAFKNMISANITPDSVAIVAVLTACSQLKDLEMGKWVVSVATQFDIRITSNVSVAMIDMYAKSGDLSSARQVFDRVHHRSIPSCNAMIDGYCKLGNVEEARKIFDSAINRDLITFNSMISGYVRNSQLKRALSLFREMNAAGLKADNVTLVTILSACASLGALQQGRTLHAHALVRQVRVDLQLGTSLLDMYAKCGKIEEAVIVFERIEKKDLLSWTAIISGLSFNGEGRAALDYFARMKSEGIEPNAVAYVAVLSACSHSGMVPEGRFFFDEMRCIYGIAPEIEHYGCMVDILSRGGLLKEAEELIQAMPVEPNAVIWSSFLSACRFYKDVAAAEKAGRRLLLLEPDRDAGYVQMCRVYANSGMGESSAEVRRLMEERGVKKTAGCSSIVVHGEVHEFVAGERRHPEIIAIRVKMEEMGRRLRAAGYVGEVWRVTADLEEEEKELALEAHSERMAIAFGLIKIGSPHLPLQILKNLRTCEDCHLAIKLISKIWNRRIIVRDRSRFHHFQDGRCSCNDFW